MKKNLSKQRTYLIVSYFARRFRHMVLCSPVNYSFHTDERGDFITFKLQGLVQDMEDLARRWDNILEDEERGYLC